MPYTDTAQLRNFDFSSRKRNANTRVPTIRESQLQACDNCDDEHGINPSGSTQQFAFRNSLKGTAYRYGF